jgi:hypothetical protein
MDRISRIIRLCSGPMACGGQVSCGREDRPGSQPSSVVPPRPVC